MGSVPEAVEQGLKVCDFCDPEQNKTVPVRLGFRGLD